MDYLIRFVWGVWGTFAGMAPYLLLGFAVAGVLHVLIPRALVERHLSGGGFWPVFKAAVLGVPLPLCSCGVIPVAASLRRHGSSKGATMSFLLSTPQTGVDSILVTYALLGPVFALLRPVIAFVTGLIGGYAMDRAEPETLQVNKEESSCRGENAAPRPARGKVFDAIHYGLHVLPKDIGKSLLVGAVIAGAIAGFMEPAFLSGKFGVGFLGQLGEMLTLMLIGIPLYVCATASVPIAAALVAAGISPGAALVFLITGPATNAATVSTIVKVLGRKAAGIYLTTVAVTALLAGILLNMADTGLSASKITELCHEAGPGKFETISAVVLICVLGAAFLPKRGEAKAA